MKNFFFELAKFSDQNQLLRWRNEKKTRKSSFNTKIINVKHHKLWFDKSLKKKNIWIFKNKKQKIGMVRLEKKNQKTEINYLISPRFRGKNLGQKMLVSFIKEAISRTPQSLYAKSKMNNPSSYFTLLKSGFRIFQKKKNYYIFKFKNRK